ncbi:hypothetical protein C8R45DRAFT_196226 [Mycena sanguinolenta]|nr:hypothetical protein C8R45DRAFT_196226 [Mycena sanguinolenta]
MRDPSRIMFFEFVPLKYPLHPLREFLVAPMSASPYSTARQRRCGRGTFAAQVKLGARDTLGVMIDLWAHPPCLPHQSLHRETETAYSSFSGFGNGWGDVLQTSRTLPALVRVGVWALRRAVLFSCDFFYAFVFWFSVLCSLSVCGLRFVLRLYSSPFSSSSFRFFCLLHPLNLPSVRPCTSACPRLYPL